jgi:hypothetical protein
VAIGIGESQSLGYGGAVVVIQGRSEVFTVGGVAARMLVSRKILDEPAMCGANALVGTWKAATHQRAKSIGGRAAIRNVTSARFAIDARFAGLVAGRIVVQKEKASVVETRVARRWLLRPILATLNEREGFLDCGIVG